MVRPLNPKEAAPPPWAPLGIRSVPTGHSCSLPPVTQRGPCRAPGTLGHPTEVSGPWLHPPHPASSVGPGNTLSARPRRRLGTLVPGSGRLQQPQSQVTALSRGITGLRRGRLAWRGLLGCSKAGGRDSPPDPWGAG